MKKWIKVRFKAQEDAVKLALAAADKADKKADLATEKTAEKISQIQKLVWIGIGLALAFQCFTGIILGALLIYAEKH